MNDVTTSAQDSSNVKLIYILYLASIVVGITSIIGVILAYVNKNGDTGVLNNHYRYQIRTFWIGMLYCAIGTVLIAAAGLGFLLLLATLIWFIVRCAKGLKAIGDNQAIDNVETWLI